MNLSTSYLGLTLNTPLIVGASPLADDVSVARELQDMGAGAIVMRSLFQEQITRDHLAPEPVAAAAADYFPAVSDYRFSPGEYLVQIAKLKSALGIPIIASLNGCTQGDWTEYARRFESVGADAIELNLYQISTDPARSAADVEAAMLETVRQVKASLRIPLAVKLQPFHTSLPYFVKELEKAGADGVVVFNRFYQTEFIAEPLEPEPRLRLSDPAELLLRLRWIAILSPGARASLAVTGGIHGASDVVKSILAGAQAVQVVSALLEDGPRYLSTVIDGVKQWMRNREYKNLDEFRGAMNLEQCPDAAAFERGSYQRLLQNWRPQ